MMFLEELGKMSSFALTISKELIHFRCQKHIKIWQRILHFSTSKKLLCMPIKFTTSEAYKKKISEMIGLRVQKQETPWYEPHVFFLSFAVFLIYFCYLREENYIDDILEGKNDVKPPAVILTELKLKLKYCESNKLPTSDLRAKIKELEENYHPKQSNYKM